jgi:hypothetical protein
MWRGNQSFLDATEEFVRGDSTSSELESNIQQPQLRRSRSLGILKYISMYFLFRTIS